MKGFLRSQKILIILGVLFAVVIIVKLFHHEKWFAFVYPTKTNLAIHEELGTFPSLQACRDAIFAKMQESHWQNADYECGLNCEKRSDLMICKETIR
jgi:hypothetical protein